MTKKAFAFVHAPGPWHVGGRDSTVIYASDGYAVANASTYHFKRDGDDGPNARLIAAAPEMLEALKWAEDVVAELSDKSSGEKAILKLIRDAIRKAEGA